MDKKVIVVTRFGDDDYDVYCVSDDGAERGSKEDAIKAVAEIINSL